MNVFKLAGLVLVAGWAAGTTGQMVGKYKANKSIKEAQKANAEKVLNDAIVGAAAKGN